MLYSIKKFNLLIVFLIIFVFSGCWNNRDLTDLGIVVGVGLEKVENNQLEITIQLIEPTQEGAKQTQKSRTWRSLSARGNTVFEANRNLLTKVNKKLNYSNIQLLVIGENLAQNGIGDVLDFFQRVHEIDKREVFIISKGINPRELFNIESEQATLSTLEIIETFKNTDRLASIRRFTLYDFILNYYETSNSVIGLVKVSEKNKILKMSNLDFTGAAVFKKDKLIGWLNPNETYGFLILDNKFINPVINVPNPINPNENVTIEIIKSIAKKNVLFKDNKPVLYVKLYVEGKMVEQHGKGDLTSAKQIRALEKVVSKEFKKRLSTTIMASQENLYTDIFGFGNIVHRKNLTYWNKVKNDWDDIFSNLSIDIKVEYKNKNMGFIKKHQ